MMLLTYILSLVIGSALAVPQFTATPPIEQNPQFTATPPIEEIALFDGDVSIEANDEEEMDMPERNDEGFYRVDDMFLDDAQYRANFGTDEERQAIPDESYRWPNGIVPFVQEGSVPSDRKQKIRDAIAVMNKALVNCIKFQEYSYTSAKHIYVSGHQDGACYSYVGYSNARWKGKQEVSLGRGCDSETTIQHEFLHSLGAFHVQSRPDRDNYVEIKWDNIKESQKHNFKKHSSALTYGLAYDPLSIMHYEYYAFAINKKKPTIVSKMSSVPTEKLGSAQAMRDGDIQLIRKMYGCDMNYTTPKPACKNKNPDDLCNQYKGYGYCTHPQAISFMKEWCQKACSFC